MAKPRKTVLSLLQLEARENPAASVVGHAANDLLVQFDATVPEALRTRELNVVGLTEGVTFLGFDIYRVDLVDGADLGKALTIFAGQHGVTMAGEDAKFQEQSVPNDPGYSTQWALAKISAPAAWSVSTGTGKTIVAIVDTGIDYTHPDLAANVWTNPNASASDKHGYDFANNDSDPMDDNGHGTHVAGIIGAVGNNGKGVSGVDPNATLMALKFMDASGGGYTSNAIRAIDYAIEHGAKIINNSWAAGNADQFLAAAIARAQAAGVIVVVAAGNEAANDDTKATWPTEYAKTYSNVVAVAATDQNDNLASFSNYGPTTVAVGAPGNSIYSTLPNGAYGIKSGTSMATPMVTGALALLWDVHPTWTYTQVIQKLKSSVDVTPSLNGKVASNGRINLAKMLDASTTSPPVASPPVTSPPVTSPPPTATPVLRWTGSGPKITSAVFGGTSGSNLTTLRLTFDKRINTPTLTADDVVLTGPSGSTIRISSLTAMADSGNSIFDVTFAAQTAAGTYTATVGPDVWDVTAQRMDQNGDGVNGTASDVFRTATTLSGGTSPQLPSPPVTSPPPAATPAPTTRSFAATGLPLAIADLRTTRVQFTVSDSFTISSLAVALNLNHGRPGDLNIRLRGPENTLYTLYNRSGASLANATFTVPAFNGKNAKGVWTLEIFDLAVGATGSVSSASLSFGK